MFSLPFPRLELHCMVCINHIVMNRECVVTGKASYSDNSSSSEKLLLMARLAEASARIISQIPDMDAASSRYRLLCLIVDKLAEAAEELETR